MRAANIVRKTAETDIKLELTLDGGGKAEIDTGCGFLDHMLVLFASHGRFDLAVKCVGDVNVDYHHTVEDVGICLGQAFAQALGEKKGIERYGSMVLPMDEALILAAVDFSGRDYLAFDVEIPSIKVGDFDTELVEEFWLAFVRNADCTLHLRKLAGKNSHHIIEGAFKAAARAFRMAVKIDAERANEIPSTKGVL
ncbi:MAG: imidazoleglycerol-phosphate dehydratase HisB [Ruminococcaceae bacterium]|nr:imidazoleglycerol-phosphate dehydratase HisB [Oscillospiraceae bacterium]